MDRNSEIRAEGREFKNPELTASVVEKKNRSFSFYRTGTIWGILAGVGMALFLVLIQLVGAGESIGLKFVKYLVLAGVLYYTLSLQRDYLFDKYKFKNGILFGGFVSIVSAITLSLMNFVIFSFSKELAFDKFLKEGDTVANAGLISSVMFFEVFVFGMICTFIVLQFIKPKRIGAKEPI